MVRIIFFNIMVSISLQKEIQRVGFEHRFQVFSVLEVQVFLGGTGWMTLQDVFCDPGTILHAHEHLAEVAQGVPPERLGARGRVQACRRHDGGAVLGPGQQVLQPLDHLEDSIFPLILNLIIRGKHRGQTGNAHYERGMVQELSYFPPPPAPFPMEGALISTNEVELSLCCKTKSMLILI